MQRFANETGLTIHLCHQPPGTRKRNEIDHRMFCFIGQDWRGRPWLTHATNVNSIGVARTQTCLTVPGMLEQRQYPKKVKTSDEQMQTIHLKPEPFRGEWNYAIRPR